MGLRFESSAVFLKAFDVPRYPFSTKTDIGGKRETTLPELQKNAIKRLLLDANTRPSAKTDAVVALLHQMVFVVPWPNGTPGFRTLVNADGVAALPIFTDTTELENACHRYGWANANNKCSSQEIGAREAFGYALTQKLAFVVVDITANHGIEFVQDDFVPILAAPRKHSTGPFSTLSKSNPPQVKLSASQPPAVLSSQQATTEIEPSKTIPGTPSAHRSLKPTAGSGQAANIAAALSGRNTSAAPMNNPAPVGTASSTNESTLQIRPPSARVNEDHLKELSLILRAYPEVEWACIADFTLEGSAPMLGFGLKLDQQFRTRLPEIEQLLRSKAVSHGIKASIFLLDAPGQMKQARNLGIAFFPWTRKTVI